MEKVTNTDIILAAAQISKLERLTAENIGITEADIAAWQGA